jgi:ferredoxin like protein
VTAQARYGGISFEDRMATTEFRVAPQAHITINGDSCRGCTTKACVSACPAGLFVTTSDGGVLFSYEQCFECGACYLVCNTAGAISWSYPEGGAGVVFRRS